MPNTIPIIAIDGPSASGKGTVAQLVAEKLGYHYLDSGALYRIVAFAAKKNQINWQQPEQIATLIPSLKVVFQHGEIYLNDQTITESIRTEEIGRGASEVAVHPEVRTVLYDLQRSFLQAPGLVADGRDMGSVIFPEAQLKIFLTASAKTRAERRYKQLIAKEINANLTEILADLQQRDERDKQRTTAPLMQTADAKRLDTDNLTISQAVDTVLAYNSSS